MTQGWNAPERPPIPWPSAAAPPFRHGSELSAIVVGDSLKVIESLIVLAYPSVRKPLIPDSLGVPEFCDDRARRATPAWLQALRVDTGHHIRAPRAATISLVLRAPEGVGQGFVEMLAEKADRDG